MSHVERLKTPQAVTSPSIVESDVVAVNTSMKDNKVPGQDGVTLKS